MDELNQEFLRLLSASGWKQSRAAAELHLDPGTVSRYVSMEARPSLTVLRLFATLIGERLLVGENADGRVVHDAPRALESWEQDVLSRFRRLPPTQRRRAIEGMNQMLEAFTLDPGDSKPPMGRPSSASSSAISPEQMSRQISAAEIASGLSPRRRLSASSEPSETAASTSGSAGEPALRSPRRSAPRSRPQATVPASLGTSTGSSPAKASGRS